ncbi:hypothetical protein WICPIJ_007826 [Wickerhamomyces pijperi]|uniref:Peptidase M20 dimerisation domain-containing protein n=1 Tax=Wickerhamomyces pijperi TaxID=599730 RepID=A0A9P8TIV9_WICPI|nr:hypothetical protein WICPIJ_007826 [Wickerhamomyces pijperi]
MSAQSLTESELALFPEAHHHLLELHKQIVTIPSVSGNEVAVVKFLDEYLHSAGFKTYIQTVPNSERSNIYAYKGDSLTAKVVLTSHVDTVPGEFPYIAKSSELIWGRGVNDAKGSVAAQIIAAEELYESKEIQEGDVALLFVVGEEVGGDGMRYVSSGPDFKDVSWDHVIFGEPTELNLAIGHKGIYAFRLSVTGKASHSGYPELGIDANLKLIDIIQKFRAIEFDEDELLGTTTVNYGVFSGGLAGNIISPEATVNVVARVSTDAESVGVKFSKIIEEEKENFDGIITADARAAIDAVHLDFEVPGFGKAVMKYGTDILSFHKEGVKSKYLYGPGSITNAHTPEEHIYVSDLTSAIKGYKDLVKWLLGGNK